MIDDLERWTARAGSAVHARGSGIRGSSRSRGRGTTQTSADDIHGARGSEAVNSDRVLWSVQGEGGVLSRRNASGPSQGEGDDDIQRARDAQERGRGRGDAGRRARGGGCTTSNRPKAEGERSRVASGSRSEDRTGEVSGEVVARLAIRSAEMMERLRLMARSSVVAARILAKEERNRQLSRDGAAP